MLAPGEVLLTVQGRGEVRVAPDRATISGGVVSEADSARGAVEANSRAMAAVVEAITKADVPSRAIRTAQVSVQARHSEPPREYAGCPFKREIVGFVARNSVSVELGDPARVSGLFDAMTRAGANEVFGPNLSLADPSTARRRATELAVADAQRNAETIAAAAGMRIRRTLQIAPGFTRANYVAPPEPSGTLYSVSVPPPPPPPPAPISTGELTVSEQIAIDYALIPC